MKKTFNHCIAIISFLFVLDFISKFLILKATGFPVPFYGHYTNFFPAYFNLYNIFPFFDIILVWNDGVSFSMLSSQSQFARWALVIFTSSIIGYIIYLLTKEKNPFNRFSFALIIAGAMGNIFDRIRYGAVIDFLDFYIGKYHWPAFNLADIFISVGVFLLIINNISFKKK